MRNCEWHPTSHKRGLGNSCLDRLSSVSFLTDNPRLGLWWATPALNRILKIIKHLQNSVQKSVRQLRGVGKSVRHVLYFFLQNVTKVKTMCFKECFKCPKSVSKEAFGPF